MRSASSSSISLTGETGASCENAAASTGRRVRCVFRFSQACCSWLLLDAAAVSGLLPWLVVFWLLLLLVGANSRAAKRAKLFAYSSSFAMARLRTESRVKMTMEYSIRVVFASLIHYQSHVINHKTEQILASATVSSNELLNSTNSTNF